MDYKVPALSMVFMAIAALAVVAIPTVLLLYFRKKRHADVLPFWIGCAVFVVFALILESLAKLLVMQLGAWQSILNNTWLFGIIGGLFAGVFEETGRFVAFKTVLKNKRSKNVNALMYGAGHGGFEAFYLVFISMVTNLVFASIINSGNTAMLTSGITDSSALQAMNATFSALSTTAPGIYLVSVAERISAIALHISLSVLVWFAAKHSRQFWLFPLAVLLHAFVDSVAGIMAGYTSNLWLIEGAVYLLSACCVVLTVVVWKKSTRKELDTAQA